MGFKYVLVPADDNEPMQEMTYPEDILDLDKDTFRTHCENYFRAGGHTVDREVVLAQLKEKTGVDMSAEENSAIKGEQLERLINATSVEIFPLQLPTKDTGFNAISCYCDDKGVAKELPENNRMSMMAQTCGYVNQVFKGDVIVGRVFDDNEDEWRRIDFELADCSTDAPWVEQVKKQRSNKSVDDMAAMKAKMGMSGNTAMFGGPGGMGLPTEAASGDTERYAWRQTDDDVEVTFKKDDLQKSDKKLVKVVFGRQKLKVEAKGELLIETELNAATVPDDSTWTLLDGVLQVTLAKAESVAWPKLEKA